MYCSSCGNKIAAELNFCNRCGIKLAKADQGTAPQTLSGAIGYIGGFGFLGFIFVALVLVRANVTEKSLIAISLFYFAALFGICFFLIKNARPFSPRQVEDYVPQNDNLKAATTAQLGEARTPVASVTEHTTRNFDESLIENKR